MNSLQQVMLHPQVEAVGMLGAWSQPTSLPPLVELPLRMQGERSQARALPPELGQDTDAVLRESGLAESEIAQLRAAGVVA
jgi:crotonobetainyl-CoA:carnitine CoA-transferase CaiB-like acyl-CoA transferase